MPDGADITHAEALDALARTAIINAPPSTPIAHVRTAIAHAALGTFKDYFKPNRFHTYTIKHDFLSSVQIKINQMIKQKGNAAFSCNEQIQYNNLHRIKTKLLKHIAH